MAERISQDNFDTKICRQKVWPSQIFIPTAVFRANGFHHCLQIWKKHTTMCMWEK